MRDNPSNSPNTGDVIVRGDAAGYAQEIAVGAHRLVADEPLAVGGPTLAQHAMIRVLPTHPA